MINKNSLNTNSYIVCKFIIILTTFFITFSDAINLYAKNLENNKNNTLENNFEVKNVRALLAWNMLPSFSYSVAVSLKKKNLDLLNATSSDIEKWLLNDTLGLGDDQRKSLEYILAEFKKIDSGDQGKREGGSSGKGNIKFSDFIKNEEVDKLYFNVQNSKKDNYHSLDGLLSEFDDFKSKYDELNTQLELLNKTRVTKISIQYFHSPLVAVDSNENIINFKNPKNYGERTVNFNTVEYYKVYPKVDIGGLISDNEYIAEDILPGKESAKRVHERLEYEKLQIKDGIKEIKNKIALLKEESLSRLDKAEKTFLSAGNAEARIFFEKYLDYICTINSINNEVNESSRNYKYGGSDFNLSSSDYVDASIPKNADAIFDFYFAKFISFDGYIQNDIPIKMNLLIDGKNISGYYWYKEVGIPISIQGEIDDKFKIYISELGDISVANSNATGNFTGYMSCNFSEMRGDWVSGSKILPFELKVNKHTESSFSEVKVSSLHEDNQNLFSYIAIVPDRNKFSEYAKFLSTIQYDNMSVEDYINLQKVETIGYNLTREGQFSSNTVEQIIFNAQNFYSKEIYSYYYDDGAHGFSNYSYINYDTLNNTYIDIKYIFSSFGVSNAVLTGKINANVRKKFNVDMNISLKDIEEECFSVEDLPVSDNFYLCKKGIVFVYNPYEVACYASRVISVLVPWSDLKVNIQREGLALLDRLDDK